MTFVYCTQKNLYPQILIAFTNISLGLIMIFVRIHCLQPLINAGSPDGHGWKVSADESELEITWMTIPPAPDMILQFVHCNCKTSCKNNRCSCVKAGLECTDLCNCCIVVTKIVAIIHPAKQMFLRTFKARVMTKNKAISNAFFIFSLVASHLLLNV